jgi:hypothetical protein
MYSLVVESPIFHAKDPRIAPEIIKTLKERVIEVIKASDKKDHERAKYHFEMISAIFALITYKLERRRARYRSAIQVIITLIICCAILMSGLLLKVVH